MKNFYELLKVDQVAPVEEIKKAIRREMRVWSNRTNASDLQKRQEAEQMVKNIEEAERILLDEAKRSEYDKQLRSAPKEERRSDEEIIQQVDDLVAEGWRLLIQGNIPDALFVATRATETQGNNSEAWALLGQAKFRWGDIEDAIYEYRRAIKIKPNDASYYFDLGSVYESAERPADALEQYRRASQIDPAQTMYQAAIGVLMVKHELLQEGIEILQKCLEEDPENQTYKWFLAIAYVEKAYESWTEVGAEAEVPPGHYATQKAHVDEALEYVAKAEALNVDDDELNNDIKEIRKNVESMVQRRFHGNKLVAGGAIAFGVLVLMIGGGDGFLGFLYLSGFGVLYIFSCMTPQYVLNRRIIGGDAVTGSQEFFADSLGGKDGGIGGLIFSFIIIMIILPLMVGYNFIKNYAFSK